MMDAKHTPGPWVATPANGGEWNIHSGDADEGWAIALVMGSAGMEEPNGRSDENARLIASAPDLFEALTALLDNYTSLVNSGDAGFWDPEKEAPVIAARAAIAKARLASTHERAA